MSFDYFVAELKCPNCNTVSSATGETCMQTKICKYSDYKYLGLGSKLDLDDNIEDCGYDCYKIPEDKKKFTILVSWACQSCKTEQWARIEVDESVIIKIESCVLSEEAIKEANYIDDEIAFLGWEIAEGEVKFEG